MPRIHRKMNGAPSKFWSMEVNPKGASVGNFVANVKSTPKAFAAAGKAIKSGTLGKMMYNDMNPTGKKIIDAMTRGQGPRRRR